MSYKELNARIIKCAEYYVDNSSTVRAVAKHFGLSKSQVHIDITKKLKNIDLDLYYEVCKIINKNKQERHVRGGLATKRKYYLLKSTKN